MPKFALKVYLFSLVACISKKEKISFHVCASKRASSERQFFHFLEMTFVHISPVGKSAWSRSINKTVQIELYTHEQFLFNIVQRKKILLIPQERYVFIYQNFILFQISVCFLNIYHYDILDEKLSRCKKNVFLGN